MLPRAKAFGRATSAAVALLAVAFWASPGAGAEGKAAGLAVVVAPGADGHRLTSGGGNTDFTLRLPKGASCPGDSANNNYRIQSFIVPATDDAGVLRYKSVGPEGQGRYALYDSYTRPYSQAQTADADGPGKPGFVVDIPALRFAVFPPGTLSPGRYHIGIACTLERQTVKFWGTDIVLTNASSDKPAHLHWAVADAGTSRNGRRSSTTSIAIVAATCIAAVAAVTVMVRRRVSRGAHR
jgi:hypothetical protein